MKILLDTNFLIYSVYEKIDFLSEINRICDISYKVFVPEQVLKEFKNLIAAEGNSKEGQKAKTTFAVLEQLIKEKSISVLEIEGASADDAIINISKNEEIIAATMDKALKKRINAKIITIRQKNHLEII